MSSTPALELKNISKQYANGPLALNDVSLTVNQGDFFALLGPNGAGKSTTIGIISSLINKTSGSVSVMGVDADSNFPLAKSYLGIVPQEFNFSVFATVHQVILNQAGYYGIDRATAKKRAEYYLKKLEIWDKRDATTRMLSGGMKRRLMIARALIHEPRILILDEPTAGVDIEIRRSMWDFLRELNDQGITIILTTHYLEEVEMLCERVAIINHGEVVENTSVKTLLKSLQLESYVLDLSEPINQQFTLPFQWRQREDQSIEVDIDKSTSINHLFTALQDNGIDVVSMRNKTNRLEQLFLNIVDNSKSQA